MSITLPPLPYPNSALSPHISTETVDLHYGKHHAGYVANLNRLLAGSPNATAPLESLILAASGAVFNNAAQIWNHTFYWQSTHPDGGGDPGARLANALDRNFGSVDGFREEFTAAACGHFGSGWVWLVSGQDGLEIMTTPNAEVPQRQEKTPLLTLDVWEHAYYLDYRNARPAYVETWLEHLISWEHAEGILERVTD